MVVRWQFNCIEFSEPLLCCSGSVLHSSEVSLGSCGVLHSGLPSSHCLSSSLHFPAFRDSFPWATDQHMGILPEFYSPVMRGLSLGQSHKEKRGKDTPPPHTHTHAFFGLQQPLSLVLQKEGVSVGVLAPASPHSSATGAHTQGKTEKRGGKNGKPLPHVATSSTTHHLDITLQSPQEFAFCLLPRGFGCSRQKTGSLGLTPSWPESELPLSFQWFK